MIFFTKLTNCELPIINLLCTMVLSNPTSKPNKLKIMYSLLTRLVISKSKKGITTVNQDYRIYWRKLILKTIEREKITTMVPELGFDNAR
jgi:hypothetical protein